MKLPIKFIYIFAALLPFQFALNIAPGFDLSVIRVTILFLFGLMILKSFFKKDFFVPLNLQSVCIILFLLINIFSMFLVENVEFGIRKILFLSSIMPLYFVIMDIHRRREKTDAFAVRLIKWMTLGGAISFLAGMIIFLGQFIFNIDSVLGFYEKIGPFFWGNTFSVSVLSHQSFLVNISGKDFLRMAALFPDPHNFALFAGIICFISLGFFLQLLKERCMAFKTFFYGTVFLLGGMSVFLSFSRGAYLALFGGFFAIFILGFSNKFFRIIKNLKAASRFKILAISVTLIILMVATGPVKNRFIDTFSLDDGSNAGRIQIMKKGLNIFKEHFLFGVGIGNAPLYYNEDTDYRSPVNSHNTYLEIAIENGISGLIIWIILIGGTILQLAGQLRRRIYREDSVYKYLSLGLLGSLIFFAIHSIFEVFLYSPINLSVIMILLAVSSALLEVEKIDNNKKI